MITDTIKRIADFESYLGDCLFYFKKEVVKTRFLTSNELETIIANLMKSYAQGNKYHEENLFDNNITSFKISKNIEYDEYYETPKRILEIVYEIDSDRWKQKFSCKARVEF